MDDKNFKELDHFFNSRLGKIDTPSNGWDRPNDSVLENALNKVNQPQEHKKRRPFWLWLSLSSLIIISVSFLFIQNNYKIDKSKDLLSSVSVQENQTTATSPKSELTIDNSLAPNQLTTSKEQRETTNSKTAQVNTNASTYTTNRAKSKKQIATNNIAKKINPNVDISSSVVRKTNLSNINTIYSNEVKENIFYQANQFSTPNTKGESIERKSNLLGSLEYLPFLDLIYLQYESKSLLQLNVLEVKTATDPINSKFSSFLTIGHLYSSLQMTNLPEVNYTLTDYDHFYGGWEIGTGITYDISSKTSLGASLKYSFIKNESTFNEDIDYLKSGEYTDVNGDLRYDTAIEIATPTGSHTENISLDVTNENFQDGESLGNQTNIYQDFRIASLTGYVNHELFKLSDISFALQAGIGFNMITSTKQKMNIAMTHDDHTMDSKTIQSGEMYDLEKYYINGQLGLRIDKPISRNWFIGFNSGINKSLTSIRKTSKNTDPKTYIGGFQTSINLGYRF